MVSDLKHFRWHNESLRSTLPVTKRSQLQSHNLSFAEATCALDLVVLEEMKDIARAFVCA